MDWLTACASAARKKRMDDGAEAHGVDRNRLRKAIKDDFYLRTTRNGYDWDNADPDGMLPTQHPRSK